MTDRIEQPHPAGVPCGTYDVYWYTAREDGRVVLQPGYVRDAHQGDLECIEVREDEIAEAICISQPGGLTVFGSRRVQEAWNAA